MKSAIETPMRHGCSKSKLQQEIQTNVAHWITVGFWLCEFVLLRFGLYRKTQTYSRSETISWTHCCFQRLNGLDFSTQQAALPVCWLARTFNGSLDSYDGCLRHWVVAENCFFFKTWVVGKKARKEAQVGKNCRRSWRSSWNAKFQSAA